MFLSRLLQKLKKKKYYLSVCCIQKDENDYLPEWINYNRKIGVQHFYIYDNESKISPRETLQTLVKKNIVTVIDWPGKVQQTIAYDHCLKKFGQESQWIAFIDVDEFIVPKSPLGDLRALLQNYENFGALGINWLIFGSSGHIKKTNRPQLESFVMRSDILFAVNKHIKSIVQPRYIKKALSPHHFKVKNGKQPVNEDFIPIDGPFSPNSVNKIQINHYYCRSEEEYTAKIKRGFADCDVPRVIDQFYAHDRESNEIKDETILQILKNPTYKITDWSI